VPDFWPWNRFSKDQTVQKERMSSLFEGKNGWNWDTKKPRALAQFSCHIENNEHLKCGGGGKL